MAVASRIMFRGLSLNEQYVLISTVELPLESVGLLVSNNLSSIN